MAIGADHRSEFAALHQSWWRLHMSEQFLSRTKNPNNQTNKQKIYFFTSIIYWFITLQMSSFSNGHIFFVESFGLKVQFPYNLTEFTFIVNTIVNFQKNLTTE